MSLLRLQLQLQLRLKAAAARCALGVARLLLELASTLVGALPDSVRYVPADVISALVGRLWPGLYGRTGRHFAALLGTSAADPRARALARASIQSFGRMAIDFLWLRTRRPAEVMATATIDGLDNLAAALQGRRGAIVVLPHLGCWDVAAVLAVAAGQPITIVIEAGWAAQLVAGSRQLPGVQLVPLAGSMRPLIRALDRNELVVLLADLARGGVQSAEVPFMGRPACLPSGPARLSIRYGAPLLVVGAVRAGAGRYRVEIQPPLYATPRPTAEAMLTELTARMAAGFEQLIRRYPEQWYPFGRIWADERLQLVEVPASSG